VALTSAERQRFQGLRLPKRREEWLAGRLTAKLVVARALEATYPGRWSLPALEISSEPSRRPFARLAPEAGAVAGFGAGEPLPVSVSISHIDGWVLCAAMIVTPKDGGGQALGVDLGTVEERSAAFLRDFFTEEEQRYVEDAPAAVRGPRANQVWCAKEAVLKALGLGLTVDTRDLCCLPLADPTEWPLVPGGGSWRPFAACCGGTLVPGGGTIRGLWTGFPGLVAALAARGQIGT